jgi:hypothetical protein
LKEISTELANLPAAVRDSMAAMQGLPGWSEYLSEPQFQDNQRAIGKKVPTILKIMEIFLGANSESVKSAIDTFNQLMAIGA